MSGPKARTITRDADAPRLPDGAERDPNKIYTRSGREISPQTMLTGDEDRFAFDRSIIPAGWDYQWKVKTIKNWEWIDHQVELAANGWEPVPAERHEGIFMPRGYTGNIERGGQILMERPMQLTEISRQRERRAANEPVQSSRSMAGLAGRQMPGSASGILDFEHPSARGATGVGITREAHRNDATYKYTIDE